MNTDPFDYIFKFEEQLSKFTGAPYVVTVDRCTHAIELCLIYNQIKDTVTIPKHTYISVPQTFLKLGIPFKYNNKIWDYEYNIETTNIWDSARRFEKDMYKSGSMQCISFGRTKPLQIGLGGAILLDNEEAYKWLSMARSDGRDLKISPWQEQKIFVQGYHYYMRPEECKIGLEKLKNKDFNQSQNFSYPDCSKLMLLGDKNGYI